MAGNSIEMLVALLAQGDVQGDTDERGWGGVPARPAASIDARGGSVAKMAGPCAWPSVAVLAGGGTRIVEVLVARSCARVGGTDPFPRECEVFTLHFDTADYIRYIQVSVLAHFLDLYASAKVGMSFDCKLNGAPKFDRGVIVETGVEAESGTTPQSRAGRKTEREWSFDVWVRVKKLFE